MQRAMERDVRKCKRSTVAFQTALDEAQDDKTRQTMQAEYTDAAVRLKASEKKLHDFCKQTGFLEDGSRVWVNGFGRSEAQRAVWANKKLLQNLDQSDIMNIDKIMAGYKKYIQKYPDSSMEYYMIDYKLREAGIKKAGIPVPAKPKAALLIPDPNPKCKDPNHIFDRMRERHVTEADMQRYIQNAKVMFVQWNGTRQTFRTAEGAVTLHKSDVGWIYKTTWSQSFFNEEEKFILEVISRYVGL